MQSPSTHSPSRWFSSRLQPRPMARHTDFGVFLGPLWHFLGLSILLGNNHTSVRMSAGSLISTDRRSSSILSTNFFAISALVAT